MSETINPEELREKYSRERDKRLRAAGTDQYTFTEGELAHFAEDPHTPPPPPREPLTDEIDVLAVGGGFGGIRVGIALQQAGVENFRIVDAAADFGGVWYWNRYPGLRCDVESYIYLPLLEETGHVPTERYVTGAEIFGYCQLLGRKYDLYDRAVFQTKVTGLVWDEDAARWTVTTSRGDRFRARFVTTQSGLFLRPQLPGVPGIETFKGHSFHTSRWDYDYTGGSITGGLEGLRDKRVAVIGTGTTGLQVIPHVAESAAHLTVFQRTPTAVGPRDNAPTDVEWFKSQPPGWQEERIQAFNRLANFEDTDCPVEDGWTRFFRGQVEAMKSVPPEQMSAEAVGAAMERADFEWNEMIRARVDEFVRDPGKAEKLKAYYRALCKRPGFSDEYLAAFDRDNVELVDTSETGIERITERGLVVDGVEHEVDCIIFGTGFEIGTTWSHQAGYDIEARGRRISEQWANGPQTFHGLFGNGFPNVFFMGFAQSAPVHNGPQLVQEQADHIAYVIRHCLDHDVAEFEATIEAQEAWQEVMAEKAAERRPFLETCTPGFMNAEGKPEDPRSVIANNLFTPSTEFFAMLAQWRESGDLAGLDLKSPVATGG